jgi:tetratricopeptide (TPR) repeat protein
MNGIPPPTPAPGKLLDAHGRPYEPAVGPRLRVLLFLVFAATALLGITGVYLLSIRLLEALRDQTYTNQFTLWMFVAHVFIGLSIAVPFLAFGIIHYLKSRHRKNRLAVKLGLALFASGIVVVFSGLALIQLEGLPQLPTGSAGRWVVWGLHVLVPVVAVAFYVQHRRAGPDINWRIGYAWGGAVAAFVAVMLVLHSQDPRAWGKTGPREGAIYFEPSKARTSDAQFIRARALMMDAYCRKCHPDVYEDHFHSAHRFSSFNNPPYRFSVRETRKVGMERDGHPRASRWCAGCHDPVPFFSGAFDNPDYDDEKDPTASAGITCTVCHAITNVNSPIGNADYTIEEPQHYPWAYSDNPVLGWLNNQLVKAKPDFHKKTFLKPFHRGAKMGSQFCSTCHKVSIPVELNHYKEYLPGQDHYRTYLLSGVSGHGAQSFYYPAVAKTTCNECHMPLKPSSDFGARDFDGSGTRKVHDHLFPGANTGLPYLLSLRPEHAEDAEGLREAARRQADFLTGKDGSGPKVRIDLFALRSGGRVTDPFVGPLRPQLPGLKPGATYLVEVVVRTLNVGHPFTQGTADSNEVWVDFTARSGGRIIGRSGALSGPDDSGPLDEWAHRVNVLMLDRHGNRINRRNPQDIFTPLYDHQIPPGAAQAVHYRLEVPKDIKDPVELEVKLRYRKFDFEYLSIVHEVKDRPLEEQLKVVPKLPVVDLCADRVVLPVEGVAATVPEQKSPIEPAWQRWNDYGIGLLLQHDASGKKGQLRQAEEAFARLIELGGEAAAQGHLNRARVLVADGRFREATEPLNAAAKAGAPWWTVAWFSGRVSLENAHGTKDFEEAIGRFRMILDPNKQTGELARRKFDFTKDYEVVNALARALFQRAQQDESNPPVRDRFLLEAIEQYNRVLALDPENVDAHYGLQECYRMLVGEARPAVTLPEPEKRTDDAALRSLSGVLRDGKAPRGQRLEAAQRLVEAAAALGREPADARMPKRMRFEALVADLRPYFAQESDPELKLAAARVLDELHRNLHAIFKPDDIAQSMAVREYRGAHPAADHAADAVVIYPLNRKGAPGF